MAKKPDEPLVNPMENRQEQERPKGSLYE